MQIKRLKRSLYFFSLLFFVLSTTLGQDREQVDLISFLLRLEQQFNVKFSYADEDIREIAVTPLTGNELSSILDSLEAETQLRIQKLSDRYYTITRSSTIDICGFVYDNYGQNTIPGASVEVIGSSIVVVTDMEGRFSLTNIPRGAILLIRFFQPLQDKPDDINGKAWRGVEH